MRNIAFLVIVIITVAIAVSCNLQDYVGKKETESKASKPQVTGSVETPKIFTKVVEKDNDDILNRLNQLEASLDEKIGGISVNIDNTEVMSQLDIIKQVQANAASELVKGWMQKTKHCKNNLISYMPLF